MGNALKDWSPIAVGISTALVGLVALAVSVYFSRQTLKQQQIEDERKEIYKKLTSFYGPCVLKLRISTEYSNILRKNKAEEFSVLRFFLGGEVFEGNDADLYEIINHMTSALNDLITTNSGLVDVPALRELLAQATAHFGIIDLAYGGKLHGDLERFSEYTYPTELKQKLEAEIDRLNARLDQLNGLGR